MHDTTLYPAIRQRPGYPPDHRFRLATPWAYTWKWAEDPDVILRLPIPAGYDFEPSIPTRLVWPLISPLELLTASIAHDWLYGHQGGRSKPVVTHVWDGLRWSESWIAYTRDEVDRLFGRILRELEVATYRRRITEAAFYVAGVHVWDADARHGGPVYRPPLPQLEPELSVNSRHRLIID